MQVDIRYKPAFATLFATLAVGDRLIAEAGAMASMTSNVQMTTRFNGGFLRALVRRIFGGESIFINEYTCSGPDAGQLVLTQAVPGDITCIELQGNTLFLQPGAFIACGPNVKLGLGWAGFASWFSGEGLFRLVVTGHGPVWFGGYGGIFPKAIKGEHIVDSGHLVAYEPTLSLHVGLSGGIFSSFFGGEGFITRVRGEGIVYLQSRSLEGLASWTNSHL